MQGSGNLLFGSEDTGRNGSDSRIMPGDTHVLAHGTWVPVFEIQHSDEKEI